MLEVFSHKIASDSSVVPKQVADGFSFENCGNSQSVDCSCLKERSREIATYSSEVALVLTYDLSRFPGA